MTECVTISCKPTRWFILRALAMLAMFLVFTVWFYYDAEFGYRNKNEAFFTERAFHKAVADFAEQNRDGTLTPDAWEAHATGQYIKFPDEEGILPTSLELPIPWPELLHDFEKVRKLNPANLWREYTASRAMNINLPEEYYPPRKIHEQWVVFWICLALSFVTLFFLLRTLRRSIKVDGESVTDATGLRVPYEDLTLLDLRKWDTKGIAFADYRSEAGAGRMRIDGLTYGGFSQEKDQPAERMMEILRKNFSGEILEYATAEPTKSAQQSGPANQDSCGEDLQGQHTEEPPTKPHQE